MRDGIVVKGLAPKRHPYLKAGKAVPVFWPPFPLHAGAHRAGPVLQDFGLVLQAGVWHSTSEVQAPPWG